MRFCTYVCSLLSVCVHLFRGLVCCGDCRVLCPGGFPVLVVSY